MQQGPTRRQTVEFQAYPGWQDAPQTMDVIPVMPHARRPHAHLRSGALTFPDVANRSFRLETSGDWHDLLPYSVAGFAVGWVLLGLLAWWM